MRFALLFQDIRATSLAIESLNGTCMRIPRIFCCFIFWLGIKILCDPTAGTSHFLFGDDDIIVDGRRRVSKKDEAFGDWMKRALCGTRKDPIPLDLQIRLWGCPGKDLGAHSNRKGNYELLCGIIDGPPVVAAMIRAGHKIGGVEEKYILQPRGGDEYCSRACAGFDVHSDDFATLPAHFTQDLLAQSTGVSSFGTTIFILMVFKALYPAWSHLWYISGRLDGYVSIFHPSIPSSTLLSTSKATFNVCPLMEAL
jgi:hypothetical protein